MEPLSGFAVGDIENKREQKETARARLAQVDTGRL